MFGFKKKLAKTEEEIYKISKAAKIVDLIKKETSKMIVSGISTKQIELKAKELMDANNAISATIDYHGYPAYICISINEVLVHGIPSNYVLRDGDLVTVDVSLSLDGFFADSAYTKVVGNYKNDNDKLLCEITKEALDFAIKNAKPGIKLKELGKMIDEFVTSKGFSVTKEFVGHGIGSSLHEEPSVPNFYDENNNYILEENMIICIEPMIMSGEDEIFIDPLDGWTARSIDGKNNAHDEETILITKEGGKILTNS